MGLIKRTVRAITFSLLSGITALSTVAFAQPSPPKPPTNLRVVPQRMTDAEGRFFAFEALVAQKCLSCHRPGGSGSDFTLYKSEYAWVNSSGLVVPGNFNNSTLNLYLKGGPNTVPPFGTMPPGIAFSSQERDIVKNWVDNLAPPPPPPSPTPSPTLPPTATPTPGTTPTPSGSPTPTPTPGSGTLYSPSDAAPPLGSGEFVKSVLDQAFGPSAASITQSQVSFYRSIFGGACDRMGQPPATGEGNDVCTGFDASLFSAPVVPKDSARRYGRLWLACLRLVSTPATRDYAIQTATGTSNLAFLSTNPIPTTTHLGNAYKLFYPAQPAPPAAALTALTTAATIARQQNPTDNYIAWQTVLMAMCGDPFWQVR